MKILSTKVDYKKTAKNNKNAKTYNNQKGVAEIEKKDKKTKAYRNPANTLAGKIIIIILALAMALGGLFSLIYAIGHNSGAW